ncbi:MAG: DUF4097 domain-containing protein [Chloroflexota bacterium]|nr:DUF4097 domain-containing protein [Chloroflexota bacterium]
MTQSQVHDQSVAGEVALAPIPGSNGRQATIPLDPSQPLDLSVTNSSGKVRIVASDQPNVWIVARRSGGDGNDDDDGRGVRIDVNGNRIAIHPDWAAAAGIPGIAQKVKDQIQQGLHSGNWNVHKLTKLHFGDLVYDFRIEVPRALAAGSKVQVKTASGDVHVEGVTGDTTVATASADTSLADLKGQVAVHTASGDVTVERVDGSLEINTASGDVSVRGADAWLALRTMSGDLQIDDATLRNARVTSVSGDLQANAALINTGAYAFETVSGDMTIRCRIPAGASAAATFRSLSGDVHVSEAWAGDGRRSWKIPGEVDGPRIQVKSVSGDLTMTGTVDPSLTLREEEPRARTGGQATDDGGAMQDDLRRAAREAQATASAAAREAQAAAAAATQEIRRAFDQHRGAGEGPDQSQATEPLVTPPPAAVQPPQPALPASRLNRPNRPNRHRQPNRWQWAATPLPRSRVRQRG